MSAPVGCLRSAATFVTRNYVAGDYLEFGVWEGHSFIKAYHSLQEMRRQHSNWLTRHPTRQSQHGESSTQYKLCGGWRPQFFAFDSFEGLPETLGDEIHEGWAKGSYACSEDQFKKNIAEEGVDLRDVITVVNIDCDLYESTTAVLDFITDVLVQGSILIFDDWHCYQGRTDWGEQRACREWLARNPQLELIEFWREPPQPMRFLVNFKR